jgi:hypothetical protein
MGATSFENVTEGSAPNADDWVAATKEQPANSIEALIRTKSMAKYFLII